MKSERASATHAGRGARPAVAFFLATALAFAGSTGIAAAQTSEGRPMTSAQDGGSAPAARLRPLLAESLAGWQRRTLEMPEPTLGPRIAQARAEYRRGGQVAVVDISDLTATPPAPWSGEPLERATDAGRERVWRDGQRTMREETGRPGQRNTVAMTLANGVVVGVSGVGVPIADLRRIAEALDLAAAEKLARR